MFPRYTMPPLIQAIGNLFPMTYFIPIARGIITKGVGFSVLSSQVIPLSIYIVIVMILASVTLKQRLE